MRSFRSHSNPTRPRLRDWALVAAIAALACSGLGCASLQANMRSLPSPSSLTSGVSCSAAAAAAGERLEASPTRDARVADSSAPASPSATATAAQGTGPALSAGSRPDELPSAQTPDEKRDVLDARLARELAELDAMLRRETELIAEQRAERDGPAGSGSGQESWGEVGGQAEGQGEAGGQGGSQGEAGDPLADEGGEGSPREGDAAAGETGGREAGGGAVGGGGGGEGQAPKPDKPGARKPRPDCPDDIVARQIREAATREKDAELKKKLWKEYEAYKNATCAKRKPAGKTPPPPSSDGKKET